MRSGNLPILAVASRSPMRDLEIRGAGNLLGAEQHGHMEAVGYDLYCKMLNESVKELKGETQPEEEFDTVIDLDIDAFIPERYIKNEFQKLDVYKRIATIESEEEYDDMLEELMDRFGEPAKSGAEPACCGKFKSDGTPGMADRDRTERRPDPLYHV